MTYPIVGDARKFTATFLDLSGNEADPDTVTLEVRAPSGAIVTYAGNDIVNEQIGVYSKIVSFDEVGEWSIEWQGSGAIQKVANFSFYVKPQLITPVV